MDEVFKALSDPSRRKILDIVRDQPGINVNDLAVNFEVSRFSIMKHLRVLEDAGLIISKREWKDKKLYLNAVPLRMIYERWIKKYEDTWASLLIKLKHAAEGEKP